MIGWTRRQLFRAMSSIAPGLLLGHSWPASSAWASSPPLAVKSLAEVEAGRVFEVCVIGSGPAGAILASALVRRGVETVVVESGLDWGEQDPLLAKLDAYTTSGKPYPLLTSRFRGIGGTSNLWTGSCMRLYPHDLAQDNAYAPPGAPWPIRYEALEPFYARAEAEMSVRGVDRTPFAPPRSSPYPLPVPDRPGKDRLADILAAAGIEFDRLPESDFDGEPLRTRRTHLPQLCGSRFGTLVRGCTATRLLPGKNGDVSGLRVRTTSGAARTLRARTYVIACGAVETCRLLLLSRAPGFPTGIGIGSDLVGRGFMTHYGGPTAMAEVAPPSGQPEVLVSRRFIADSKSRGLGAVGLRFILNGYPMQPSLAVVSDLEMEPTLVNRISLNGNNRDLFGDPGAHLHLEPSARDLDTRRYAGKLVQRIARNVRLENPRYGGILRRSSHHHMGGCRMGSDPKTSVVDADLRLHGTPNLHVAGSAPFVTCGVSHPTLTICALSLRLADHLAARIDRVEPESARTSDASPG